MLFLSFTSHKNLQNLYKSSNVTFSKIFHRHLVTNKIYILKSILRLQIQIVQIRYWPQHIFFFSACFSQIEMGKSGIFTKVIFQWKFQRTSFNLFLFNSDNVPELRLSKCSLFLKNGSMPLDFEKIQVLKSWLNCKILWQELDAMKCGSSL